MAKDLMIIKTKKLSAREVKKKLRDFIDDLSEDCGPEVEQLAEELKAHGDEFVDALSGVRDGTAYRDGKIHYGRGVSYRHPAYRDGEGQSSTDVSYRNEGDWKEREELRQQNERKMQELEREMRELKLRMQDGW